MAPYDLWDGLSPCSDTVPLSRPSGPKVQNLCRRLGYEEDEAFGPFPGANLVALVTTSSLSQESGHISAACLQGSQGSSRAYLALFTEIICYRMGWFLYVFVLALKI